MTMTSLVSEICFLAIFCLFLLTDNGVSAQDVTDYDTMLLDLLVDKYGNDGEVFSGRSYGLFEEIECTDKNQRCSKWKRQCNSWKYKDFLKNFCPETCGHCPDEKEEECVDEENYCQFYKGYCNTYGYAGMMANCPKTCGRCSSTPTWGKWKKWSKCSATCGNSGTKTRTRMCEGGSSCPGIAKQTAKCNRKKCSGGGSKPKWTKWSTWSSCSATCGRGQIMRSRNCPQGGCSGKAEQTSTCVKSTCPCTCAKRSISRSACRDKPLCRWRSTKSCKRKASTRAFCPKKCDLCGGCTCGTWNEWKAWSKCSVTCGEGTRRRRRTCPQGKTCDGPSTETESCSGSPCGESPQWTSWSTSGSCSKTCGSGKIEYIRTCNGGRSCLGSSTKTTSCNTKACPTWSVWKQVGSCSASCGGGEVTYQRTCPVANQCPGDDTKQETCNENKCDEWSTWEAFGECSKSCGSGTIKYTRSCGQTQKRRVASSVETWSTNCEGAAEKTIPCNEQTCPSWSDWVALGSCSEECGGGLISYTRVCSQSGGCPGSASKDEDCNTEDCGELTSWAASGPCSESCGGGVQTFTRECPTGKVCQGSLSKTIKCNPENCASWTSWEEVGACSATCEGGRQNYKRECKGVGTCPGEATKVMECNRFECPVVKMDWSEWGEWSDCTKTCGAGVQTKTRTCIGGSACPGADKQHRSCSLKSFCDLEWGNWTPCSKSCGMGTRVRMATSAANMEFEDCMIKKCPRQPCTDVRADNSTCCDTSQLDSNSCGVQPDTKRIIGGQDADKGEWPWIAKLSINGKLCGANLIDKNWVLTAAHCLEGRAVYEITLRFGMHERIDYSPEVQIRYAKRYIIHPEYRFPDYDIALIELSEAVVYNDYVKPICLPQGEEIPLDTTCMAIGWGIVDLNPETIAKTLQEVELRVLSNTLCSRSYGSYRIKNDRMICAGRVAGTKDTCGGDSGGPLMCQRCTTCQWMLWGITSFGSIECGKAGSPGVYSKVAFYETWINYHVGRDIASGNFKSCTSL